MEKLARIVALNDAFRKGERPELGRIMITAGARELVAAWPLGELILINQVRSFDIFTEDNDPYGEHDFGSFHFLGENVFWKISYYDPSMEAGSEDPSDPEKCSRVLTIMLSSEW